MIKLEATKQAYLDNMGQEVKVGRYVVTVSVYRKSGRSGSYERGFKFTSSNYGMLHRAAGKNRSAGYSCDHGVTWSYSPSLASKVRSGKILLEREAPRGEFAYDSIQRINAAFGM